MNCASAGTLGSGGLTVLWLCASIALVVFGVMLHSILTFHTDGETHLIHKPLTEAAWALIPMLILFGTAVPAVAALLGFDGRCS